VGKRLQNSPVRLTLLVVLGRWKGTQVLKEATTHVHKSVGKLDGGRCKRKKALYGSQKEVDESKSENA
jgi:hypothetical protein